jgi:quercetin dioxygenase-like cupin family protein
MIRLITPSILTIVVLASCKNDNNPGLTEPPVKTHGITEKVMSAVDLGPEIEGMAGRKLRMRLITMEPGAATALHDHKGRPGTVYIIQGTITDHRDGTSKDYGPGAGWPEEKGVTHWIENKGNIAAVEISVDIFEEPK